MPKRIQRRRAKGWRMPPGCVSVTRPSPFGNPFRLTKFSSWSPARVVSLFRECLTRAMRNQPLPAPDGFEAGHGWVDHFEEMAGRLHELRDKDLACFCPLGSPCHADVLLELANA